MTFARRVAVAPILVYRRVISPLLPPRCKYYPSCSEYAVQAIDKAGNVSPISTRKGDAAR